MEPGKALEEDAAALPTSGATVGSAAPPRAPRVLNDAQAGSELAKIMKNCQLHGMNCTLYTPSLSTVATVQTEVIITPMPEIHWTMDQMLIQMLLTKVARGTSLMTAKCLSALLNLLKVWPNGSLGTPLTFSFIKKSVKVKQKYFLLSKQNSSTCERN